jgi:hypothetical protein
VAAPPSPPAATQAAPARRRRRLSRGGAVALGLLFTLVGLFVLGGTVPTAASTLERAVAITGAGAVALWVGGLLLGSARGR